MDPWRKLLKSGWITLFAAFAIVLVLAILPQRAGTAEIEPASPRPENAPF